MINILNSREATAEEIRWDKIKTIAGHHSKLYQLQKTHEELTELKNVLVHDIGSMIINDSDILSVNTWSECADVIIMICQLANCFRGLELRRKEKMMEKDICPSCNVNDATEPHACPYQADVNDDDETLCTCCPDCQYECAMDI